MRDAIAARGARRATLIVAAILVGCAGEPSLVAGSTDSYEFSARMHRAILAGVSDTVAERSLATQGFDCIHSDTLQSDEGDSLQANSGSDDPGTEYITCDYVSRRRWGENARRRYLVVLYIREHRVDRVFAVTHLREVH